MGNKSEKQLIDKPNNRVQQNNPEIMSSKIMRNKDSLDMFEINQKDYMQKEIYEQNKAIFSKIKFRKICIQQRQNQNCFQSIENLNKQDIFPSQLKQNNQQIKYSTKKFDIEQDTPQFQNERQILMNSLDGKKVKITSDIMEDQQQNFKYISKVVQFQQVISQVIEQQNVKMSVERIEQVEFEHKQVASLICDEIMNVPFTKQQLIISEKLQKQYLAKIQEDDKKNQESVYLVILLIKKYLQEQGGQVIIQQKSTLRSSLTVKIFSTGFMLDRIKFTQEIDQEKIKWKFNDLREDEKNLNAFQDWYKEVLFKETNINPEEVVIHKLTHCCIKVQASAQLDAIEGARINRDIKFHPFFQHFSLCIEDFDFRGDYKFHNQKNNIEKRGNWPYYQPIKCRKYGLKVSGKYDDGKDTWLKMKNRRGEWAVGFHGVRNAGLSLKAILKGLKQQQQGLKKGQLLKIGQIHKCKNRLAVNKQNEIKVGRGIYCTPHIKYSLKYAKPTLIPQIQKQYRLVFQCRVNPKQLKVCFGDEQQWVVNNSKDIRPYGIILLREQVAESYPQTRAQFGQQFKWDSYKSYIQQRVRKQQEQFEMSLNQ